VTATSAIAWGQTPFTDDAQRSVVLPGKVTRVFAAGAPAEVLLYTLAPEMLAGRNHMPSEEALALIPPEYRAPVQITNVPDQDDPRYDAELLALDVDVYVDYGTVDADYVAALEAVSARTGIPGIILDGRLANIPAAYRQLGSALGVPERGERLAAEAERILSKYRDVLAEPRVRVYLACSQNGTTPCLEGHSFGEVAQWLGATNTGGAVGSAPRRPLTLAEIDASAPAVIIAVSAASAARLSAEPAWREIDAVAAGRVHAPPDLPFNWGPRPPSVNRLLGLIWMAYVLPARSFDDAFFADVRAFFETFYHVTPTREQLRHLIGSE
jgi:iron complex transport system substrate-binding protein